MTLTATMRALASLVIALLVVIGALLLEAYFEMGRELPIRQPRHPRSKKR